MYLKFKLGQWLGLGEFKVRVQKQARLMHASLVVAIKGEVKIKNTHIVVI
jgi:hypothetical protein